MKVLISAAEASSDMHGAELLKALRTLARERGIGTVDAFGVGGPCLQREGLRTIVDARELLSMGFTEILGRLPRILRALARIAGEATRERPEVAIVIDYPDFHFRLARRLRSIGVPMIYYIPPKVWVWRKKRVTVLRELFTRVLCILPFEEEFHRRAGLPVRYVGNPLLDELPLSLTREAARMALGIDSRRRVLVAMPGSRPSELRNHVELFLEAAERVALGLRERGMLEKTERLLVLVPLPLTAQALGITGRESLEIKVSRGDAHECLIAADAGLVKSGTSTLEAGILGCPHAVVYRTNFLTSFIFRRLIRYRGPVGLVNLVACGTEPRDEYLMREIVLEAATPEALSEEVLSLFLDEAKRERLAGGMARLRESLLGGTRGMSPSRRAAEEVLDVVGLEHGTGLQEGSP
ncbi:MAG: lipid-A-disaccharide synthase [Oligoflexia bacterium]|nr:lipid-A-disaccharide synthase [Oligoflexia bacterium]